VGGEQRALQDHDVPGPGPVDHRRRLAEQQHRVAGLEDGHQEVEVAGLEIARPADEEIRILA